MHIRYKLTLLSMFLTTWGFSNNCTFTIDNISIVNENILTIYLDAFDRNNLKSTFDIFTIQINHERDIPSDPCNTTNNIITDESSKYTLYYTLKIYAPEIGFTQYEPFYISEVELDTVRTTQIYRSPSFSFNSGLKTTNNIQAAKLISYISQSGRLPNGKYLFEFVIKNNLDNILDTKSEFIEVNKPISLELLYPGSILSEINNSFIYNSAPLFTWYADYCSRCTYGIRVSEYKKHQHSSLNDALYDWSLIPYEQSDKFYEIPWNTNSFQYPFENPIPLEEGKYYVWQIRRSYDTTLDTHYDYSPIYIFEVRSTKKKLLDISDSSLLLIQTFIGKEKFDIWFQNGGELENFVLDDESIWVNGEKMHIDILHLLISELNQGMIKIESIQVK